jgi:hypothetical protein
VKTARRYRTIQIQAGPQTITAADPLPDDLRQGPRPNPQHGQCALNWPNSGPVAHRHHPDELAPAHPPTRAYVARRSKEGLSKPEIIRCLKRYAARETYKYLRPS